MTILKKLIVAFILPPGIFILVIVGSGALLLKFKHRRTGLGLVVLGLIMWGFSIAPVTDRMLAGLIRDVPTGGKLPRGDVIVLLGGGVDGRLTDLSGKPGILPETMVDRLVTAVRLATRLQVPIIVSGGRTSLRAQVSEADAARRYMLDLGVPAAAIITESNSRDTYENAAKVREICRHRGFARPILVTSAYHLKRALWSFKKAGLSCTPFTNGLASMPPMAYGWEHFLPGSLDAAALYLHEYLGLVYYRLR